MPLGYKLSMNTITDKLSKEADMTDIKALTALNSISLLRILYSIFTNSGRLDLNQRPLTPHASALPSCAAPITPV